MNDERLFARQLCLGQIAGPGRTEEDNIPFQSIHCEVDEFFRPGPNDNVTLVKVVNAIHLLVKVYYEKMAENRDLFFRSATFLSCQSFNFEPNAIDWRSSTIPFVGQYVDFHDCRWHSAIAASGMGKGH